MADIRASQVQVLASISEPSEETRVSQAALLVAEDSDGGDVRTTQVHVLAAVKGRVNDPAIRVWTATIDGHDFYFLRLGNEETLVYDVQTEQWYVWGDSDTFLWGVYTGTNWVSGNKFASTFGSNILVGSDSSGSLYLLDPDKDKDDSAVVGRDAQAFTRRITSQIPVRGYDRISLYQINLLGSTGKLTDETLTSITLSYSDDQGENYTVADTINIPNDALTARATWLSLGSFEQPGRLIRIEDEGALRRVDSLTMNLNVKEQ